MNTTIENIQEQDLLVAPTPAVDGENLQVSVQDGLAQQENEDSSDNPEGERGLNYKQVLTLLTMLGSSIKVFHRFIISLREAVKQGLKIAFIKGNRDVYSAQLDKLYADLKKSKSNRFSRSAIVIPVRALMEANEHVVDESMAVHVFDWDGNEITLDKPDLDLYVAVIDGQHRIAVCKEHPDVDVDLELYESCADVFDLIRILNTVDKNWGNEDQKHSMIKRGLSTNTLYEESEKMQRKYNVSPKVAEYILTFKRDASKKKDLIVGKDTTTYDEENGNRGKMIAESVAYRFRDDTTGRKIQLWDAIVSTYQNTSDKNHPTFGRDMRLCIASMKEDNLEKIKKSMSEKNYGDVETTISKAYKEFIKKNKEEINSIQEAKDSEITEFWKQRVIVLEEEAGLRVLKSGTPWDVVNSRKEVFEAKEEKKKK